MRCILASEISLRHQNTLETLASHTESVASLLFSVYFIISHDSRKLDSTLLLVKNSVTPHSVPGSKIKTFYECFLVKVFVILFGFRTDLLNIPEYLR